MQTFPLLSIIVPVYNVREYLSTCLDSILAQPFSDYEVLLIDDGSKDGSGEICDNYASKDTRIKVVHKSNGGLSSARNAGLDQCKGNYISFIDSDDYLVGDYYSEAIKLLKQDISIDIVWLQYAKCYDNGRIEQKYNTGCHILQKGRQLLNRFVTKEAFAGIKIYKREVFKNIRYPIGQILEDLYIVPDLYEKINKCAFISIDGYYAYRQRMGSICNIKHTPRMIDDIALAYARIIVLCQKYDKELYIRTLATYSSGYLNALVLFPKIDYRHLETIYYKFDYEYHDVLRASISISQKIKLIMLKFWGYKGLVPIYKYIYSVKH